MSKAERVRQRQREERRKFIRVTIGAIGAIGLTALVGHVTCKPKYGVSYQDAKRNPALREEFLRERTDLFKRTYITDVMYKQTGEESSTFQGYDKLAHIVGYKTGEMGMRKSYTLEVFADAFDNPAVTTENDFLSAIVDHEIEGHARAFHEGVDRFGDDKFRVHNGAFHRVMIPVQELIAYRHQWDQSTQRGVSKQFSQEIMNSYYNYYALLFLVQDPEQLVNPSIIKEAQIAFFDPTYQKVSRYMPTGGRIPLITRDGDKWRLLMPEGAFKPWAVLPEEVYPKITK